MNVDRYEQLVEMRERLAKVPLIIGKTPNEKHVDKVNRALEDVYQFLEILESDYKQDQTLDVYIYDTGNYENAIDAANSGALYYVGEHFELDELNFSRTKNLDLIDSMQKALNTVDSNHSKTIIVCTKEGYLEQCAWDYCNNSE